MSDGGVDHINALKVNVYYDFFNTPSVSRRGKGQFNVIYR